MASAVIQFKRGLLANLPGLRAGEPGFTTNSYDLYVGIDSTTNNNQFVGSGRYWSVNSNTVGSGVKLVEGTDNGTNSITLKSPDSLSGITTFVMPATGSPDKFLKITSVSGNVHTLAYASIPSGSFTIAADSGSDDTFTTGEVLTFAGGEGVDTTVSDNQISIAATIASTTNTGIASFTTGDFTVASGGLVALQEERIQDIAGGMFTGNTETGITATYQDGDGTVDLEVSITTSEIAADTLVTESEGIGSNDNDTTIPTSAAVKDYVDNNTPASSLDISGDNGTASVSTGSTFAFTGTDPVVIAASGAGVTFSINDAAADGSTKGIAAFDADDFDASSGVITLGDSANGAVLSITATDNETTVSRTNGTVTIGLPEAVTVTTSLTTPTVKATNLQANDGTTAITITDSTGAVDCNQNLTVQGNLIVNGSTTQVNTSQTTIEDQLLELGMVDGSAPSSDLNKDIGVLFNYYTDAAKKAAVFWDDSTSRIVVSQDVSESSGVITNNTSGVLEIASLYINGCTGSAVEVIKCTNSEIFIENATIDGGSF